MSIKCVKTGATCYVDPWNAWIHGDAYETRDETVFIKWNGHLIKDRIPHHWHYCFHTWEAEWGTDDKKILVGNKGQFWKAPYVGTPVVTATDFYHLKEALDSLSGRKYRFYHTRELDVEKLEKAIREGQSADISVGYFIGGI